MALITCKDCKPLISKGAKLVRSVSMFTWIIVSVLTCVFFYTIHTAKHRRAPRYETVVQEPPETSSSIEYGQRILK